ncbi:S-layer homology domain-containing protein [Brevibacillus fluminis]|uniref:S-layer homology domain-containing protein n=1 Tax=Brevibacillus fluminis TaxID=511487 RepID=UPI003F8C2B45
MQNNHALSTKAFKKVIAGAVLASTLAVSNTGMAANALPLSDIAQNANKDAILKLNYAGVLKGYTDGTFKPQKEVTRAEFAKIAVLAMGYTDEQVKLSQGATMFKDLPRDHWASGYINLAVSKGIIKGYPDGTFKPNNTVNVAEAVTVFVQGLKIDVTPAKSAQWYLPYLLEANKVGIYDTTTAPTTAAKRDLVAAFTDRFMETSVYANGAYYDKDGNATGTIQKLSVVKGAVAAYDKSANTLKIVGQDKEVAIASNAQVFGNIVVGAQVEYVVKNGKAAFLNVVTADARIMEGVIKTGLNFTTAVGDERKFKAIVNGKETVLEVESGVKVTSSQIGQKFVAVLDEDGKVSSITISQNEASGIVKKTSTVSGTNPKQEIVVDNETYQLASDATIKVKDHPLADEKAGTFADIEKGDLVKLTLNVDGKVSAVTYTKLSVTEPIHIDTNDNLISFGDYEYDVLEDTKLYVDEDEVSELGDLKDGSIAILTFDQDGNVSKIEQGTGVTTNQVVDSSTAYVAGSPATPATIKVAGTTYRIPASAKLTIDGQSVSATTLKADQLAGYRITTWKYNLGTNEIVELTAEKQTVTGYVTAISGKKVTINNKVYELLSGVTIDADADTNDKEYTLTLNNSGKVKAIASDVQTVSGVVDTVEVKGENGSITSAQIAVNGKVYDVSETASLTGIDQFEYATLTLNRDGEVVDVAAKGKMTVDNASFVGIESRVNGDKYVFYNNTSTSLKLDPNAKVKYYNGSDLPEKDVTSTDHVNLWTNDEGNVYLIVVTKR